MYRAFNTFDEFEQLSGVWDLCQVFEKVSDDRKNVYVTENVYFAMILEFQGAEVEDEYIIVRDIEKESSCVLYCSVTDEEKCKSVCAESIKIKLKLYDYGPVEKESATTAEYIEQCVDGAVFKKAYFGYDFLNDAEKKLADHNDYIYLLTRRDYLKYTDARLFENAKKDIADGTPFAAAFNEYMKESCGIKGRTNRKKLKKEIEKHIAEDFDESYFISLCKEAVKDYETAFYGGEKYDDVKQRATKLLEEKGFSGEYPLFERKDSWVNFGVGASGDEWELYARFGTSGENKKKYRNFATGSDILTIPCLNCEKDEDRLELYVSEILNILEEKPVSNEFRQMTTQEAGIKTDRSLGIFCILFALCGFSLTLALACADPFGFISYFTDGFASIFGVILSIVLFVYGVLLVTSGKRGRYLAEDKGEKI